MNWLPGFKHHNWKDILTYCPGYKSHVNHINQVLTKLWEHQFYVKREKCDFHLMRTAFLGFIIRQDEVAIDQDKVKVVTSWPTTLNACKKECLLVFTNFYCQFIWGFSTIASPLNALLKNKPWKLVWNSKGFPCLRWFCIIQIPNNCWWWRWMH